MSASLIDKDAAQRRGAQPRALIVTIYGLYARQAGGWLSVGSLVKLMAEIGVDESGVRSSVSRLKRRGVLEAEKVDGVAGYALSERAGEILREGDRRIFERPRATAADGWVMAVFSVPESERQKRHMLRSRLAWLGFGTVASGVWIAPAHLEPETRDVLERYDLTSYVNLFRAEHVAFGPVREQIGAWWDLAGLERLYDDFVSVHGPVLARWRRRRADDDARAFADYVRALTDWRRLPFLDPGLPVELLPKTWRAAGAADTFFALQDLLADPARRHVGHVTGR